MRIWINPKFKYYNKLKVIFLTKLLKYYSLIMFNQNMIRY